MTIPVQAIPGAHKDAVRNRQTIAGMYICPCTSLLRAAKTVKITRPLFPFHITGWQPYQHVLVHGIWKHAVGVERIIFYIIELHGLRFRPMDKIPGGKYPDVPDRLVKPPLFCDCYVPANAVFVRRVVKISYETMVLLCFWVPLHHIDRVKTTMLSYDAVTPEMDTVVADQGI